MINKILDLNRKKIQMRKGASTVELAVVLPIFILVTLGAFEFASWTMTKQHLVLASREGARQGARPFEYTSFDSTMDAILDAFPNPSLISISNINVDVGQPVTITLGANPADFMVFPPFYLKQPIIVSTTMRKEGYEHTERTTQPGYIPRNQP